MAKLTREQYLAEIKGLEQKQAEIWEGGLQKYLAQACALGLCAKLDTLRIQSRLGADAEQREKARLRLESEKTLLDEAWMLAVREVEHIEIAKAILLKLADGRL